MPNPNPRQRFDGRRYEMDVVVKQSPELDDQEKVILSLKKEEWEKLKADNAKLDQVIKEMQIIIDNQKQLIMDLEVMRENTNDNKNAGSI